MTQITEISVTVHEISHTFPFNHTRSLTLVAEISVQHDVAAVSRELQVRAEQILVGDTRPQIALFTGNYTEGTYDPDRKNDATQEIDPSQEDNP